MPDFDTTQLRSLAADYKNKADFLTIAADLQDNGYQADQVRIDTEIQKGKDVVATEITDKDTQIVALTQIITDLTTENNALKNPVVADTTGVE